MSPNSRKSISCTSSSSQDFLNCWYHTCITKVYLFVSINIDITATSHEHQKYKNKNSLVNLVCHFFQGTYIMDFYIWIQHLPHACIRLCQINSTQAVLLNCQKSMYCIPYLSIYEANHICELTSHRFQPEDQKRSEIWHLKEWRIRISTKIKEEFRCYINITQGKTNQ